jgi:hypothetical protein
MTAPTDAQEVAPQADERYGTIETGDGETIVYDRETPEAWVQSDTLLACET